MHDKNLRWWLALTFLIATVPYRWLFAGGSIWLYSKLNPQLLKGFFDSVWLASNEVIFAASIILALIFVLRLERKPLKQTLNLSKAKFVTYVPVLLMVLALGPWRLLLTKIAYPNLWNKKVQTQTVPTEELVIGIVSGVLLVPILEEIIFRGYIFNAFKRFSRILAVIVTALLFGLWHFDLARLYISINVPFDFSMWHWITHVPMGIILGICVIRTKSVLPLIFAHALWNLLCEVKASPVDWFKPEPIPLAISAVIIIGSVAVLFRMPEGAAVKSG